MDNKTTTAGFALTHVPLAQPPVNIPNRNGQPFKTELVLERSSQRTHKLVWWHEDDDRTEEPHNHPWPFDSTIRNGGYTDNRWWLDGRGAVQREVLILRTGDVNHVPTHVFHCVTDVLPGTVTEMICGPAADGNEWGYLNTETGAYTRAEKDPTFMRRLRAGNLWMKPGPDDWVSFNEVMRGCHSLRDVSPRFAELPENIRPGVAIAEAVERITAGHPELSRIEADGVRTYSPEARRRFLFELYYIL